MVFRVVLAFCFAGFLSVAVSSMGFADSHERGNNNVIVFGQCEEALTLDPQMAIGSESFKAICHIFENLIRFDNGTMAIGPSLAEKWICSKDKREWTFFLRKGVLFHDGTPFDSRSVKLTFSRMIDPGYKYYKKDSKYAVFFRHIKKIETPGSHRVKFILKEPYAPFLNNLCMPAAGIVSPDSLDKWGDEIGRHPVGTGPFKFSKWTPGDVVSLKKNDDYWGVKTNLKGIVFKKIPNVLDRVTSLRSGNINVMDGFSMSMIQSIAKDDNLQILSSPAINVGFVAINTKRTPLDNVSVRRAMNMAINKEKLVKLLCSNSAVSASGTIPPNQWGHNPDVKGYPYSPEKARMLLKKEGFAKGFEVSLLVSPISRSYIPDPQRLASLIKASLEAVGIRVKIDFSGMKNFRNKIHKRDFDLCIMGWSSDNGDPDNILYTLFSSECSDNKVGLNLSQFENRELDRVLYLAQKENNQEVRTGLYKAAQKILHNEAPIIPFAHGNILLAARREVKGVKLFPIAPNVSFHKVWME